MITVGLIKELAFVSLALKAELEATIKTALTDTIHVKITNNTIRVHYKNHFIWEELIESAGIGFGVESCDALARIIYLLNNNDLEKARELFFFDPRLKSA
jgi:hypothetical protein